MRRAKRRANLALPENMGYPKRATSCMYRKIRVVRIAQSPNTAVRKESPMKMDAMLVLPAEPARARGCLQGIRVHHVLRADTMTGRRRAAVPKEPTRMRRAKHRASHAHLESTGYNNPEETKSCTSRRVTAVKAVRSARTAALKALQTARTARVVQSAASERLADYLRIANASYAHREGAVSMESSAQSATTAPTQISQDRLRAPNAPLGGLDKFQVLLTPPARACANQGDSAPEAQSSAIPALPVGILAAKEQRLAFHVQGN